MQRNGLEYVLQTNDFGFSLSKKKYFQSFFFWSCRLTSFAKHHNSFMLVGKHFVYQKTVKMNGRCDYVTLCSHSNLPFYGICLIVVWVLHYCQKFYLPSMLWLSHRSPKNPWMPSWSLAFSRLFLPLPNRNNFRSLWIFALLQRKKWLYHYWIVYQQNQTMKQFAPWSPTLYHFDWVQSKYSPLL